MDFNEARLHEANLHTHARICNHLSIASIDGKQRLSEVVFSALVRFSMLEKPPEFGEQPEVSGSHIRRVRSLTNDRSLGFRQKCQNQVRGMRWSIVVIEAPISC